MNYLVNSIPTPSLLAINLGQSLFAAGAIILLGLVIAIVTTPKASQTAEPKEDEKDPLNEPLEGGLSEELIVVITAAVASQLSVPTSQVRIRGIRLIEPSPKAWTMAGRLDQLNGRK